MSTRGRWRLVLGRFAERRLPGEVGEGAEAAMEAALDFLYGREYGRLPDWIRGVRELFPADVCDVITRHALDRYGMHELVTDRATLARLEPSYDLLKTLLSFRGLMQGEVMDLARQLIRQIVDELRRKLAAEVRPALWGRLDPLRRTRVKSAHTFDLARTVRANLAHWDPDRKRLLARDLIFRSRVKRHLPWHVIIVVDCSGSMIDSVIHSAVMASILRAMPAVRVRLLAFDTSVVDLSDAVEDPVEVLMSVQLGGGTDIAGALATAAELVETPTRSVIVLVTDFVENGSPVPLVAEVKRLRGEGVRVLGLAALDGKAAPSYDQHVAGLCADAGAEIAAMTPRHLAEWLARVMA
jgi:Mg-chelatase subunit ChlD